MFAFALAAGASGWGLGDSCSKEFRRAYSGKGSPFDIQLVLTWAVLLGHIKNPAQAAIQEYCDAYIFLDCTGFAEAYFSMAGKIHRGQHVSFGDILRRKGEVTQFRDIRRGDVLYWTHAGRVGHVAVVDRILPHSPQNLAPQQRQSQTTATDIAAQQAAAAGAKAASQDRMVVAESCGAIGPCVSTYSVMATKTDVVPRFANDSTPRVQFKVYRPRRQVSDWVCALRPFT